MTFSGIAGTVGAQPNVVLEIDLDQCTRSYGVSPCTAAAGTGNECYNSRKTCQDAANYDQTSNVITFRFSMQDRAPIPAENIYPVIERISTTPTKLVPGKGLSTRSKLDITLVDFTDNDTVQDPYYATRNYIATEQGTFFGKLLARWPYHNGRTARLKLGYHPTDGSAPELTDFDKTLTYVIDRIEGPDTSGRIKIVGKDPLSLAEAVKSQIPEASTGTLSSGVTSVSTMFPLQSGEGADYAATTSTASVIRINDEIIHCTGRTGDTLTAPLGNRGFAGTTAASHDADDAVQLCYEVGFLATGRVDSVVSDILQNYAGIDASYLPTSTWSSEADTWLAGYNLKNIISEPMAVSEVLDQICVETGVDIWWNDEDAEINFKANTPSLTTPSTINDEKMIHKSASLVRVDKDRLSQVWFYTGVRNYAEDRDKAKNFASIAVRVDTDSEGATEYNQKGIKKVYCNWVQNPTLAGQQASRLLNRYADPPARVKASLPNDESVAAGDQVVLESDLCQSADGSPAVKTMQVISQQYNLQSNVIDVEMLLFLSSVGRSAFVTPTGTADYTTSGADANPTYSWICVTSTAQMGNGDEPYLII